MDLINEVIETAVVESADTIPNRFIRCIKVRKTDNSICFYKGRILQDYLSDKRQDAMPLEVYYDLNGMRRAVMEEVNSLYDLINARFD